MILDVIFISCYDKNPPQNPLLSPQNSLKAQFLYNAYQRILYFTVIMSLIVVPDAPSANLQVALENSHVLRSEMNCIASELPEYETVMNLYGVGDTVESQLMAEIGDTLRFHSRKAITAYFGYDSENDDSGTKVSKSNPMTKKGASALRRTLFTIMITLIKTKPADNPVYQFLDKKRTEGKNYYW